jgi:hypothetical protein
MVVQRLNSALSIVCHTDFTILFFLLVDQLVKEAGLQRNAAFFYFLLSRLLVYCHPRLTKIETCIGPHDLCLYAWLYTSSVIYMVVEETAKEWAHHCLALHTPHFALIRLITQGPDKDVPYSHLMVC